MLSGKLGKLKARELFNGYAAYANAMKLPTAMPSSAADANCSGGTGERQQETVGAAKGLP